MRGGRGGQHSPFPPLPRPPTGLCWGGRSPVTRAGKRLHRQHLMAMRVHRSLPPLRGLESSSPRLP